MAEPVAIPTPVSNGTTDVPSTPPPAPAGFSDTPPSAPPVPAGFSDTPHESGPNPLASLVSNGQEKTGAEQFVENTGENFLKGIESTTTGIGKLIHKIPGIGEKIIPSAGLKAEETQSSNLAGGLPEKIIGYGGENLAEFMLGDEALKGLSLADKFAHISGVMKILEKSPRLMKALQMGTDIGKATGELGPAEQEALKKSPILARLVGHGMDAVRQGVTQAAQTEVKSGGDTKKAAEEGATMAATSGVLGGAFGLLGRGAEKAGEAGKAVQEASEAGAGAPTKVEIGQKVASQIQDADAKMHGDFEAGIQDLKGKLGDAKVPYKDSPLQKAAKATLEGITDKQTVPGKEEVSKILDESGQPIVKQGEPTTVRTTKGVLKEFGNLAGGSPESKNLLTSLADPKKAGDLTIDELVQRRQQLGEKIGQLTKGATSSADRADVQVYQKLRDGIDQTIDSLAKNSGSPEASQDYAALRNAYKGKVNLFKEPVIKAMQEGDLDNAGKYLLAGGKTLDKLNTLEQVIGKDGVKQFGQHIAQSAMADATSESGQINPAKFAKGWKKIDALAPEVKARLFDMTGAADGLDKLSKDLKSAAGYQKLVRGGILGSTGALTHGWGLMLGLLGHADMPGATALLDKVANSPKMWSAFRTAGSLSEKVAASPAARRAGTAVTYGAGSALSNVLQGAAQPLSSPIQQDDSGTYTNQ